MTLKHIVRVFYYALRGFSILLLNRINSMSDKNITVGKITVAKADLATFVFLFLTLASRQGRKLMKEGRSVFVVRYSATDDSLADKCEKHLTSEEWMLNTAWTSGYCTDVYTAAFTLLSQEGMIRLKPESGIPRQWRNFGELHYSLSDICAGDHSNLDEVFGLIDRLHD